MSLSKRNNRSSCRGYEPQKYKVERATHNKEEPIKSKPARRTHVREEEEDEYEDEEQQRFSSVGSPDKPRAG